MDIRFGVVTNVYKNGGSGIFEQPNGRLVRARVPKNACASPIRVGTQLGLFKLERAAENPNQPNNLPVVVKYGKVIVGAELPAEEVEYINTLLNVQPWDEIKIAFDADDRKDKLHYDLIGGFEGCQLAYLGTDGTVGCYVVMKWDPTYFVLNRDKVKIIF